MNKKLAQKNLGLTEHVTTVTHGTLGLQNAQNIAISFK